MALWEDLHVVLHINMVFELDFKGGLVSGCTRG
jgi:hypothetical protein